MSLQSWITEWKISRIGSKLKRLHVRQRQVRDKSHRLDQERKKGGMPDDAWRTRHDDIDTEKRRLTEQVNALVAEEHALRATLDAGKPAMRS